MKTLRVLIELLVTIETAIIRHNAARRATRAALQMALNGCK